MPIAFPALQWWFRTSLSGIADGSAHTLRSIDISVQLSEHIKIRFTPNGEMRENDNLSHVVVRSSQLEGQELWGKMNQARSG
jgi:hypothetical protein